MKPIETNIFPFSSVSGLNATYEVVAVDGLATDHDEYHENCHRLQRRTTKACGAGVITLNRVGGPVLAVPIGHPGKLPASMILTRAKVTFHPTSERLRVDFNALTPETERLAIRYLQTALRDSLRSSNALWQPDARNLFFEKVPLGDNYDRTRGMYRGFGVTVVRLPDGRFGAAVDVQFKFIALHPLRSRLRREEFDLHHKTKTFVYHFGDNWYEIELGSWTSLEVAEYPCIEGNSKQTLLRWLHEKSPRPVSAEIARLDKAGTVVEYTNGEKQTRGVPAQLCYRMFDSEAPEIQDVHRLATRIPDARRFDIRDVLLKHFGNLNFGGQRVFIATDAWKPTLNRFDPPDLLFGGDKTLTVRGTAGATPCDLSSYGRMRLRLLEDHQAGPYTRTGLCRQYLVLPKTVENTWGSLFERDFVAAVNRLYPHEQGYNPTVIYYDDTAARTHIEKADAIAAAMADSPDGFAVVMLPDPKYRSSRRDDELAACATDRLSKLLIIPAFVHAHTAQSYFEYHAPERRWDVSRRKQGRTYASYLRLAALNKVLLTAQQWPFVLGTRLQASVIVGIDVKGMTVGFTAANPACDKVATATSETKRKERLSRKKCREMLISIVTKLAQASPGLLPETLVVQRDGRMFEPEIEAAKDALEELKRTGVIAPDATLTCIEIPKSGSAPFRLFDDYIDRGQIKYRNPQYGTYCVLGENDGFVCNTGLAFGVPGTVRPLHVRRVFGAMPIVDCLSDVFFLACLTWSQPEGCSRVPATVRLNDRQLVDVATPFDDEDDEAPQPAAQPANGGAQ